MVVDTSAVIAIMFGEPDAKIYASAMERATARLMATPNMLECSLVADRFLRGAQDELDHLMLRLEIEPVAFSIDHLAIARRAFHRYGKGRHKAALNFGDCIAYALSKASGEPLLFKGEDFRLTDVVAAL